MNYKPQTTHLGFIFGAIAGLLIGIIVVKKAPVEDYEDMMGVDGEEETMD